MADYKESVADRKPLAEGEVVVHVPKGHAKNIRVVESADAGQNAEIVVQVSKKRVAGRVPVLGVIVK